MSDTLAQALVAAQAEMPNVAADADNPHFRSRFVSLDHLIAQTRPVLNGHGLAISQFPATNDGLPVLRTVILHGPSGEQLQADTPLFLQKNDMQALGAAVTYARRYAWAAALGIASEEDDDGNTASQEQPRGASEQPASTPENVENNNGKITRAQHAKIAVLVKGLDENGAPYPDDYQDAGNWIDVLKRRLETEYGVDSRTKLTTKQASDLIEWLAAQEIPF